MNTDTRRFLASVLFFKGLSDDELKAIESITAERLCDRHQMLFSDGEESRGFFLVLEGRVKVFKVSPEGKEQILHLLGPGEPVGQVAVFAGSPFPASAQAIEKCRLLYFSRQALRELIAAKPSLALNMLAILSRRLVEFTQQIENLSLKEVPARLAAYLLLLLKEQNRTDRVVLNSTKAQLASIIGTIPETLSRVFGRMAQAGMIQVKGRTIRLIDTEALATVADSGKLP